MALINVSRLNGYAVRGRNVLLEGHAGVGKSSAIFESFGNLKSKYFSAPTMDPWIDLVGAPRDFFSEKHQAHALMLVRPEWVLDADVEIIFFDELNRASPKVLDAVMELIQFKSINGFKFKNLKAIWAAINPETEDYTVEKLDRALRDRFHVQIQVPYDVDDEYFNTKYPSTGAIFCSWWRGQSEDVRHKVSPRRLDYLAQGYEDGDPLSDYVPAEVNVASLRKALKMKPFQEQMDAITTDAAAAKFLKIGNNATQLLELVKIKERRALEFFKLYKHVLPVEFVQTIEPVADASASKSGVAITTFADFLKEIGARKKDQGGIKMTEYINTTNFAPFLSKGDTLQSLMKTAIRTKPSGWSTFVLHMYSLFGSGEKSAMLRAAKKEDGTQTILMQCLIALVTADADDKLVWTQKEREKISNHMYVHKIVPAKWA